MPVVTRFHELQDRVVETVDGKFAEKVRLSFMKKGATDPDRPQIVIEACLRTGASEETASATGRTWRSRVASKKAQLHIDRAAYSGPMPTTGDRVRAIARKGAPAFEVLSVDDRNDTRLILELGQL